MLRYYLVLRLVRNGNMLVKETEDQLRISYAQAFAEGHGRKYVGSLGVAAAERLGHDQPEPVELVAGLDYVDVYHQVASAIQLGGNDDPLLGEVGRLREGSLVAFEVGEERQIDRTRGRMVDRANVLSVRVLEQAPARGPRVQAAKR